MSRSRPLRRLGVSGKMASGKDAVAAAAVRALGLPAVRLNLADAIRRELADCFDLAEHEPDRLDSLLERYDPDGRHSDQLDQLRRVCLVGGDVNRRSTAVRVGLQQLAWLARQNDPDVWIRRHRAAVDHASRTAPDAVIITTDVREPGEVTALADAGFVMVRLQVAPETQRRRLAGRDQLVPDHTLTHPNETALDDPPAAVRRRWAAVLDNDGPLEQTSHALAQLLATRWQMHPTPPPPAGPVAAQRGEVGP
jgi:predicted kinase